MHAELTIGHDRGDLLGALRAVLPPEDRNCLVRSLVFGKDPAWQQLVSFATETPQWRLAIYVGGADQLELTIEPVQGSLKQACESLWRTVRRSGEELKPTLLTLSIVDEGTTHVISRASVGLLPQGRRREFWLPIGVGVVSLVVLLVAGAPAKSFWGALPGFVGAIVSLGVVGLDAKRKELVWHE